MHCAGFYVRFVVEGFQHETVELLVLGLSQQVVVQVVDLYLVVFRAEHVIELPVQLQGLTFPDLEVVAAGVGFAGV